MVDQTRIAVIGDGALGLACARSLAMRDPAISVTVFAGRLLPAASRAAGAMIAPWSEVTKYGRAQPDHEVRMRWAMRAHALWDEQLSGDDETNRGLITGRGTFVIRNSVSNHLEDENYTAIKSGLVDKGIRHETISPNQVPGLNPTANARPSEALYIPDEFTVASDSLHQWQIHKLELLANVTIVNVAVRPSVKAGRVTGVQTSSGEQYDADQVLIASGVLSRNLLPEDVRSLVPPILAGAGGAIVVSADEGLSLESCIRTPNRAFACGLHVLPAGAGRIYVGATNNILEDPWASLSMSDAEFLARCARTQVNRGLANSGIRELRAGNRPVPIDLLPIIGDLPIEGLWMASGTYREGLTLAPAIADALTAEMLDRRIELPNEWRPVRTRGFRAEPAATISQAVDHQMAVIAEHELELGQAGMIDEVRALYGCEAARKMESWAPYSEYITADVLSWIPPESNRGDEIRRYFKAWDDKTPV